MITTTNYSTTNLKTMVNTMISVRGRVLGLHTDAYYDTYATIYHHPPYGGHGSTYFAVLYTGVLDNETVLYRLSDRETVDGGEWFVVEGTSLLRCTKD